MERYSTNLTDKQWQVIEKIVNQQERKRKHSLRNIINAILYLLKTGCQWRIIPKDFAPWESVYYYFSKWKSEGNGQGSQGKIYASYVSILQKTYAKR